LIFFAILLSPQIKTLVFFGILFGLIGIIVGVIGVRKEKKKIMSFIGIILGGIWLVAGLSILANWF